MKNIATFIRLHLFRILTIIFWLSLIASYFYFKEVHNLSNEQIMKSVYFFLKKEWIYWWIIYVSIYALRTIIFFPSSLLILLSASLFGLPMAIVYTILWENLSASFGYILGRFFGKNILSESFLDKFAFLKKKLRDDSFLSIITARLIFVPFDPLSYVSGFFKAEYLWYFWWTIFGTLPSILIFVFVWAWIKNIESFQLWDLQIDETYMILSWIMISLSLGIAYFIRKRKKKLV